MWRCRKRNSYANNTETNGQEHDFAQIRIALSATTSCDRVLLSKINLNTYLFPNDINTLVLFQPQSTEKRTESIAIAIKQHTVEMRCNNKLLSECHCFALQAADARPFILP